MEDTHTIGKELLRPMTYDRIPRASLKAQIGNEIQPWVIQ